MFERIAGRARLLVAFSVLAVASVPLLSTGAGAVPPATCNGLAVNLAGATAGDDVLLGTAGNDVVHLGNGNDRFDDQLGGNDTICGGGGDDVIMGGSGDDWIDGGLGADEINGGSGEDTVSYKNAPSAVTVDLGSGTASGGGGNDTLTKIRHLVGSDHDDKLSGNAFGNRIEGRAGNDRIKGKKGDDVLLGGDGDDVIQGRQGNDQIDGGPGTDTASFFVAANAVTVDLVAGTAGGDGADSLSDIENVSGSRNNDTITGDDQVNELIGFKGNDDLDGGGGDDLLRGKPGNDTLWGRDGDDRLLGGGGDDTADGGIGDDFCQAETEFNCGELPPGTQIEFRPLDVRSLAISGDTVVLGAFGQRSVYVFTRSGSTWSQQAELSPSGAPQDDEFGYSVAISGDTVLVGAPLHDRVDPPATPSSGAVFVFTRTNGEWAQQAKLTAPGADGFGGSVAISANTAAVGAPEDDFNDLVQSGSIYVFTRIGGTWSPPQRLEPSLARELAFFGGSVSIYDDTIVSGALPHDMYGRARGAVHVFTKAGGVWSEQQKLTASDTVLGDRFGESVAIWGDTVLVGAPFGQHGTPEGIPGGLVPGNAYVFTRTSGVWSEQQKLTPLDSHDEDRFGAAVAVWSNTAVIGNGNADVGNGGMGSSVYAFIRSGDSWNAQEKLTGSASLDGGNPTLSISDHTAVVKAPENSPGYSPRGGAYVFDLS